MKAAVLKRFGEPLSIEELEDPNPGPDDAIIGVRACGIDGTDLKLINGFGYTPELPFIMGHEPAGVVEAVGARVTEFRPGDRVVPYIFIIPPDNPWYRTEREQLCPDLTVLGVKGVHGAYAERFVIPANQLVHIPDGVAWHDAAVHCDAGLTAYHAVQRARLGPDQAALVVGVGGVGSFAVQFAKLAGARVIAVEQTTTKLDWAKQLGAAAAISSHDVDRAVSELTDGRGVDCVLDIVGTTQTMAAGVDALRVGGRIVVVGYTPDTFPLSGKQLAQTELEFIGSRGGSRRDLAAALKMTAEGKVRSIVTDRAPLSHVNEALQELRDGNVIGRSVLDVTSDSG